MTSIRYKSKHTVSVLVPVYNEEELLEKALKSIPRNVAEIILVNDGSEDTLIPLSAVEKEREKL